MKKNSIAARICAAALACGIAATPALALAQTCVQPADTAIVAQDEDYDRALRIALDHAGVTWDNAHNCSIYYSETSIGTPIYVVEFETADHFYGFQIHAETFQIIDAYVN
jgi:hypothetical protein